MAAWTKIAAEKRLRVRAGIPASLIDMDALAAALPRLLAGKTDVTGIPAASGFLNAHELDITESSLSPLLENLRTGTWSSVAVTTAFLKRAIIANELTNCLTEIFPERALERARELDRIFHDTGKTIGPLHGLPVSVKDQVHIKGVETTMGWISRIGNISEKNAVSADILEEAGAVLYVKTNIPQTAMWSESFNHIFGRVKNPHNITLTGGGSSGGEGALIAMKGSPLGGGTDIGGSIRNPAGYNGLYGLRPTAGRIPFRGIVTSFEGQDSVRIVHGPLSRSLDGVQLFMQTMIDARPWTRDPLCIRKPWETVDVLREHGGGREPLCFAIMWDDGVVKPHPPVVRGLEKVRHALLAAGHKVIEWKPHRHQEMVTIVRKIYGAGSFEEYNREASASGEPVLASMSPDVEGKKVPRQNTDISSHDLYKLQLLKRTIAEEYLDHWNATVAQTGTGRAVDAIICPVAPSAAPPHGKNLWFGYTGVFNGLDYPSLVIPVTRVDLEKDATVSERHEFYGPLDEIVYKLYDSPKTFANAPIGVQIVGRSMEDEAVLAMGQIVDTALKRTATLPLAQL
ncbi:general amidase [Schizophyllum amplum]|uniref:amidase n=1 Tax=Schizophyllum amplum TaxID=97359 RepID=A0A550CV99_9AGAR|nr:general amidase [Auriculariopsis ampla]